MSNERLGNDLGDPNGLSLPLTTLEHIKKSSFEIAVQEKAVLRELAKEVKEISQRKSEDEKILLWKNHNHLKSSRPLVFCDPENGWYEMIPHTELKCTGNLGRIWEFRLRKEIYWAEKLRDDRVITDKFYIQYVYDMTDFGLKHTVIDAHDLNGAYAWEPDIKNFEEDIPKMHTRKIILNKERSEQLYTLAQDVLGDILDVQYEGCFWWSNGMTWDLVNFRGMTQTMMDMYDYPDELHQLMALLRDDVLQRLDFLEENSLLTLNTAGNYVGSGGFGWTDELPQSGYTGQVRTKDMWGFCESQETIGVSPEMFKEFVFDYQLPIMGRFGLNCYGCCEPLHKRWDIIKTAPNLRRVSVSAWADRKDMAEKLGREYVYSWKPNPADLAVPFMDAGRVRTIISETVQIAKNCNLEIIMKDNHTLGGNPQNAIDWTRIAKEEAGAF